LGITSPFYAAAVFLGLALLLSLATVARAPLARQA
jgi:hypothetical protein